MPTLILNNIFRFVLLTVVQVLLLNNIGLHQTINPFLYILFIIMLPSRTPVWLVLILAASQGLVIDVFSNTGGIHLCANVLLAFARYPVIAFLNIQSDAEAEITPSATSLGASAFLVYSSILVGIHHLFLFYLENFKISEIFHIIFQTIISGIFTLLLIMLVQYMKVDKK